jgi:hypothetical protein
MDLSCLNIRQEYAKLNIEINNAKLQLKDGGKQVVVDAATSASKLDITTNKGGLKIDSYPSRYARGQKSVADFSRDGAQEGRQAIKDFASKCTQTGDAIRESKGDIPNVIFNNMEIGKPPPTVVLKYVTRPSIEYTPDKLNISYRPSEPDIKFKTTKVENNTQFSSINYSLAQEASIRMWVSQGKYDIYA